MGNPRPLGRGGCQDNAVTQASGQIWDIDGHGSSHSEQWQVIAYNGNNQVATQTSPLGEDLTLDGLPWTFNLAANTGFDKIEFNFIGSKDSGVGLAFDNFNTNTLAVPEPGVLGMFGFGLFLIGLFISLGRRRRSLNTV